MKKKRNKKKKGEKRRVDKEWDKVIKQTENIDTKTHINRDKGEIQGKEKDKEKKSRIKKDKRKPRNRTRR